MITLHKSLLRLHKLIFLHHLNFKSIYTLSQTRLHWFRALQLTATVTFSPTLWGNR